MQVFVNFEEKKLIYILKIVFYIVFFYPALKILRILMIKFIKKQILYILAKIFQIIMKIAYQIKYLI